jgi:adenylate cyclase
LIGYRNWIWNFSAPKSTLEAALNSAKRAVQLAPEDFYGQLVLAQCYRYNGDHELARRHLARAEALNPNRPGVLSCAADEALYAGFADQAVAKLEAARAVDPFFEPAWYWSSMLLAQYCARNHAAALTALRRISSPASWDWAIAAAAYASSGQGEAAGEAARRTLEMMPDFAIDAFLLRNPFQREVDRVHVEVSAACGRELSKR